MVTEDESLRNITITLRDVKEALCQLDPSKAPGPDGIPTHILKDCMDEIAPHLTDLFNTSLTQSTVPHEWKEANVVLVHKKGDPTNPSN